MIRRNKKVIIAGSIFIIIAVVAVVFVWSPKLGGGLTTFLSFPFGLYVGYWLAERQENKRKESIF